MPAVTRILRDAHQIGAALALLARLDAELTELARRPRRRAPRSVSVVRSHIRRRRRAAGGA